MLEWLYQHRDSLDLEHARQREHDLDLQQKQQDPMSGYEVIDANGVVVENSAVMSSRN